MVTQEFYSSSKEKQLEKIIDLMCQHGDVVGVEDLKKYYESEHNTSFDNDRAHYEYSFLKNVTLYQAIRLYDNLAEKAKKIFIDVILDDHHHLYKLVRIHNSLRVINTEAPSKLAC